VLLGCSAEKPPPKAAPATAIAAPAEPVVDLSPVAAPADLIAVARLNQPAAFIDNIAQSAGLPLDWRSLIVDDMPDAARVLAWDAPVDAVVALGPGAGRMPDIQAAISIPLTSLEGALALSSKQGRPAREIAPGIHRVESSDDSSCVLARAVGPAKARLVCSPSADDLDALLPYMTRGLPRATVGARDLHAELRLEPLRRRYGSELRQLKTLGVPFLLHHLQMDAPEFDRAVADATHSVADELLALLDDVDALEIDATRESDQSVDLSVALRVRQDRSWVVQTFRGSASRASSAPEAFWQMPGDATLAGYGVGADPARYAGMRSTISALVSGLLATQNIKSKASEAITALIEGTWFEDATVSYAHGAVGGDAAPSTTTDDVQRLRENAIRRVGWYVAAIEKEPAVYRQRLDAVVQALGARDLRTLVAKRLELRPDDLPSIRSRGAVAGLPGSTSYEVVVPLAFLAWFDDGGMEVAASKPSGTTPPKKPAAKAARPKGAPLSFTLLLSGQGTRTWLALAGDPKLARQKLDVTKAGAAPVLAARQGLEPLRTRKLISGGFLTLRGLAESVPGAESALRTAPAHGETPLLTSAETRAQGNPLVRWSIRVPRAAIQDVASSAGAFARAVR
jgi:hypothetical protein